MILSILAIVASIGAANPGDVVQLSGEQPALYLRGKSYDPPITIKGGSFPSIRLDQVSGVTLDGQTVKADSLPYQHSKLIQVTRSSNVKVLNATLTGPGTMGGAIDISAVTGFEVRGAKIAGLLRGVTVASSSGGTISGNRIWRMAGDGINVADSRDVAVSRNVITDFSPLVYADGSVFHPDAIQMWSVAGKAPQSNIVISENVIACDCQGITQFDHAQGGSDGVVIRGNFVASSYPHGIALYEARRAIVANNVIRTLPGAKWQSRINIYGGSVALSGNSVGAK